MMRYPLRRLLISLLPVFYTTNSVPAPSLHQKCQLQCAEKVLRYRIDNYDDCMEQCYWDGGDNWVIRNETGTCELLGHDLTAPPACSAGSVDIIPHNVSDLTDDGFNVTHEYVIVAWTPCPFGLSDVKGYEVRLREVNMHQYDYCKQVYLKKILKHDALNTSFSVLFDNQELRYGREYAINIEGLPKTSHRSYFPIKYIAKTCETLNGLASCECGLEGMNAAPEMHVSIKGYSIVVTIPEMKSCFNVYIYKFVLGKCFNDTKVVVNLQEASIRVRGQTSSNITHTFFSVHASESKLFLQYRALAYGGKSLSSKSLIIYVPDWRPKPPTAVGGADQITVIWNCAPQYFNITEYEVGLNWFGLNGRREIRYHSNSSVLSNCNGDGKMSVVLPVRQGIYSAQVRERRSGSSHLPSWSVSSNRTEVSGAAHVTFVGKKDLVIAASVVFPLTAIIFSVFLTLCFIKKGRCRKIRHSVPSRFMHFIDKHQNFEHCFYSVWLVWQADTRTHSHKELHAANIRHLAAFLTNHCGLSVMLDQYEVPSSSSFISWLQEKKNKAEFVVFVCPHLSFPRHEDAPSGVIGNFLAVFRLFESALFSEETSVKFVTIRLPYSDAGSSDAAKLLLSTTPTFKLMDDIENFYFFVQGHPKAGAFGRHVVKYVSKREYAETAEGQILKDGIEKMVQMEANFVEEDMPCSIANDQGRQIDFSLVACQRDVKRNHLEAVRKPPALTEELVKRKVTGLFKPLPPPPVISEEDAEQSLFLINAQELLSLQPIESEPIDPIISNSWCPLLSPRLANSIPYCHAYNYGWMGQSGMAGTCTTDLSNN